jgi:RNA polymerase sigma-70 factor (ECF subfamily)
MTYAVQTFAAAVPVLCRRERVAYARDMNEQLEDSALMLRYQAGDVAAFEALYRRHNDSLYRYLLRLSLNRHTAEDLFQEAWGKIIRARASYRPTARFSTFLFRVAHNCFIDHVRRNKRYAGDLALDLDSSATPDDGPDQQTEKLLARRRLHAALKLLPPEQRDVFLLYEEGGLSVDDIATITDVNRETAKSRLRYANEKLRRALAGPATGSPANETD